MKNKLKTCSFCNQVLTGRTKTKEHVWPLWLQRKLNIEKIQYQGNHTDFFGSQTISTRTQSTNSLVLGGVCAECNSGWMSDLETKAIPILENLWVSNNKKYIYLEKLACETIALWAFKTSLAINLSSNYRKNYSKDTL